MELYYPLLDYLPHKAYRALDELVLFAISARYYGIRDDKHPTFIIYGKTMDFKTSNAKFIASMIGRPREKVIINLMTETKKSTFIRRDSRGNIVYARDILKECFVCFDEWAFAPPEVRDALKVFIDGRIKVPVENDTLEIRCVPMITTNPMNYVKTRGIRTSRIEDLLEISEAQIRRSIILHTNALNIPKKKLIKYGDKIIEEASRQQPINIRKFQPPKTNVFFKPSNLERIYEVLEKYIIPDYMDSLVDVNMIALLATGALAYIPDPAMALRRVIQNYLRVVSSIGWVKKTYSKMFLS